MPVAGLIGCPSLSFTPDRRGPLRRRFCDISGWQRSLRAREVGWSDRAEAIVAAMLGIKRASDGGPEATQFSSNLALGADGKRLQPSQG
jgi:hypothetical protein